MPEGLREAMVHLKPRMHTQGWPRWATAVVCREQRLIRPTLKGLNRKDETHSPP